MSFLREHLQNYPDIVLVAEFGHVNELPQLSLTICHSSHLGDFWRISKKCCARLKEQRRTDILVYGFDFYSKDFQLLSSDDDPWAATVATGPYALGRAAMRPAMFAYFGESIEEYYSLPMHLITKASLKRAEKLPQVCLPIGKR